MDNPSRTAMIVKGFVLPKILYRHGTRMFRDHENRVG
jgi:hypothetical protein